MNLHVCYQVTRNGLSAIDDIVLESVPRSIRDFGDVVALKYEIRRQLKLDHDPEASIAIISWTEMWPAEAAGE